MPAGVPTGTPIGVPGDGTRAGAQEAERARTQRIPWHWRNQATADHWVHHDTARWYGVTEAEYWLRRPENKKVADHVGRIMESELGEQRIGDQRCQACQDNDHECWVYSQAARGQVKHMTPTCARCRHVLRFCSFSTRKTPTKRIGSGSNAGSPGGSGGRFGGGFSGGFGSDYSPTAKSLRPILPKPS